jgi:hypothetical protein
VRVTWRVGSSNGKSESYVRHFKERFGNGAPLSLQRLCEGKLKGSFHTGDSEKHVIEGSGNGTFLIGLHKKNLRHLTREDSANMFTGIGNFSSTGYNPRLLPTSLQDITP